MSRNRTRVSIDRAIFSFDDEARMRRYAFEALIAHSLWLLFLFGFTEGFSMPFIAWLESFYQWDARWYGTIAMSGHGLLPQTYVFPPLHGWLLGFFTEPIFRAAHLFVADLKWIQVFYVVAFACGVFFFAVANSLFVYLSERRWNIDRTRLWLIAVANPMAYFAVSAYSDLFFFAAMMAIIALALWTGPRHAVWGLSPLAPRQKAFARLALAILMLAAPWIRLTGFAFAIWAFLKRREVLATLLSLVVFLGYYAIRTGDPFFFLFAQKVFGMPEGGFTAGLELSLGILFHIFTGDVFRGGEFFLYWVNFGFLPILSLILSTALAAWLAKRREYEWALLVVAVVALSHNQAFWRSTVRYTLAFFPLFFWMLGPRRKIAAAFAIGISLMIQVLYCRLFQAGGWAF